MSRDTHTESWEKTKLMKPVKRASHHEIQGADWILNDVHQWTYRDICIDNQSTIRIKEIVFSFFSFLRSERLKSCM